MTTSYRIGPWLFDADEKVLRNAGTSSRLEDRSARTLALLCERRGEIVNKQEILAAVWQGRTVSPNSVAIVIGDLRRALREDARAPVHLQTIPQRGYRLAREPVAADGPAGTGPVQTEPARKGPARRWLGAAAAAALLAGVAAFCRWQGGNAGPAIVMTVGPTINATGRANDDALAAAVGAVVLERATRLPRVRVLTSGSVGGAGAARRLALGSKLILWNGAPEVALTATDPVTGTTVWSRFAGGPPGVLARTVAARIDGLRAGLSR